MSQTSQYISIGNERLHYLEWGSGKKLLLAFHGYGNDAGIFKMFREHLEAHYTILSFDLPYHGNSTWPEGTILKKKNLLTVAAALMKKYSVDKISLMGYSMGGRICMTIVEHMPADIDKVVLLATDGLAVNRLYYFCTRTAIGRKIFKDLLERPEKYFRVIEWLKKKNRLDPSRYRFVMQYLQSTQSRRFLLQTWPGLSDFIPDPAKLKRVIKQHGIKISIFMGVYDRIMPPKLAEKFKEGLDTVQVHIFEKGHRVFDYTNAQEIAQHLL